MLINKLSKKKLSKRECINFLSSSNLKDQIVDKIISNKKIVITFDSASTYEPVVANMILECGVAINILRADVNEKDGYVYGRMVLQIPEDEKQSAKIISYLNKHNITYTEE